MNKKLSTTKSISITIPRDILAKLNLYVSSRKGMSISKVISLILEDFFETGEFKDKFKEIENNELLVPVSLYCNIYNIGKAAFQSRVEKGMVKIQTIYGVDYVVIEKESLLNVLANIVDLRDRVKKIEDFLLSIKQ